MSKKSTKSIFQQGDVLLQPIEKIPENAIKVNPDSRGLVLAEGEFTGHTHVADPITSSMFRADKDIYLVVAKPTVISHQEHGALTVPKGKFKVGRVVEADPFEKSIRTITD